MQDVYVIHKTDGAKYQIPIGQTKVGRGQNNDIVLKAESVSRRHALFLREGDSVFLLDLGSVSGTFVNGRLVERNEIVVLNSGDDISFGPSEILTIVGCSPAAAATRTALHPPTEIASGVTPCPSEQMSGTTATDTAEWNVPAQGQKGPQQDKGEFGFEPSDVEFRRQGIGGEAASVLAKKFRPMKLISAGGMGKILLV
jgi:predicted component of type VI protein secretion system